MSHCLNSLSVYSVSHAFEIWNPILSFAVAAELFLQIWGWM